MFVLSSAWKGFGNVLSGSSSLRLSGGEHRPSEQPCGAAAHVGMVGGFPWAISTRHHRVIN